MMADWFVENGAGFDGFVGVEGYAAGGGVVVEFFAGCGLGGWDDGVGVSLWAVPGGDCLVSETRGADWGGFLSAR